MPRTCPYPDCGTILSKYNPSDYCSVCAVKVAEEEALTPLEPIDLAVLSILTEAAAFSPAEYVDVEAALRGKGYEADCWIVEASVRRIYARHGIKARGVKGTAGYRIEEMEYRYSARKVEVLYPEEQLCIEVVA